MNKNSLEVWENNVFPSLTKRQQSIINLLQENGPMTMYECAIKLKRFPNQISGRFSELEKKGKIEVVEKVYHEGRPNNVYNLIK